MSGWVKMEKDLRGDLRVKRMAAALIAGGVCNAGALPVRAAGNAGASLGVTLVLGGLAQLWMHADSFARDDDTLEITANEINELTGIEGFAQVLPADWLQIVDEHCVKLPDFHEHNGVEAKRRAQGAKRVARHRAEDKKRTTVTSSNAPALPDQTRPDQTRPRPDHTKTTPPEGEEARAARSPCARLGGDFELTEERRRIALGEHLNPEHTFAKFTAHWKSASGPKARKADWDEAWRYWCLSETDTHRANGAAKPRGRRAKTAAELEAEEAERANH